MSERVKPDVHRWVDDSALYDRSTILRVIDEEIAKTRALAAKVGQGQAASALEFSALCFEDFRARFEEADDAQG